VRRAAAFIALTGLAACQPPLISGTRASGVRALSTGMSYDDVVAVLGQPDGGALDNTGGACLTWYYDDTDSTKFINATFGDGELWSARTNFRGACHEKPA